MSEPAILAERVSKAYRLPLDHASTLQYRFSHMRSSSRYRDLLALDDVSFSVAHGEFIGITGPNGCGKSTLLKVLSGILRPDTGRIAINGPVSPFLELGVGFKPELTARENIFLGGAVLGLTRSECAARAAAVLDFAELKPFADQKLKNFSSGMTVRLAFSVAMLADAAILLMDEVLAVGDARFQEKCFEVFSQYKQRNRTIVLVSHDIASLELFCDRVLLLQSGRVVEDGASHKVISKYRRIVAAMSEPEEQQSPAADDLTPAPRWGSREVEVTHIRMLGQDGAPRHTFLTGEALTIVVDYAARATVKDFQCGVRVRAGSGHVIGKPFTKFAGHRLPDATDGTRGRITYRVPSLSLLQGSYFLSAYLYDAHLQHAYDHVEDAVEFRVADESGRLGVVELGGSWEHLIAAVGDSNGRLDLVERDRVTA